MKKLGTSTTVLVVGTLLLTIGFVLTGGSLIYRHKEKKACQAKSAESP